MPKFIVQCQMSYTRTLQFGVEAESEAKALDLLDREVEAGALLNSGRPVLLDEYTEDYSPLFPVSYDIVDRLDDGEPCPEPVAATTNP